MLRDLSIWIDEHNPTDGTVSTMQLRRWQRCAKVGEEFGEVIEVLVDLDNQNPRKTPKFQETDLIKELLDVALTALCAVEHLSGNVGSSGWMLDAHTRRVFKRAGLGSGVPHA